MVSSSIARRSLVVIWELPAPVPTVDTHTTIDEVPNPSETPLSSVSEKMVSSVGTSEDSGQASSSVANFGEKPRVPLQ
jgi:hypothetical protein